MKIRLLVISLFVSFTVLGQDLFFQNYSFVKPASGGGTTPAVIHAWQNIAAGATVSVTVAPTAGNLLVVYASSFGTAVNTTVTDNLSSPGWVRVVDFQASDNTVGTFFYLKNCPSGLTTITVAGASQSAFACIIQEVTGCSTTAPFTTGEFTGQSVSSTANPQTASLTYATANSIIFAGLSSNGSSPLTGINGTGTTGGTWAFFSASCHNDSSSVELAAVPNIVKASAGSIIHGWNVGETRAFPVTSVAFHP